MSTNNRNPLPLINTDDALENLRNMLGNSDAGTTFSHPDMSSLLESLEANIISPRWSQTKPYWENIRDRVNVMCKEGIVFGIENFGEIWCNIPGMPNEGLMTLHLHDVMGGSRQQWIYLQEFVYKTEKQLVAAMKKDPINLTYYKPLWYEMCKHRRPGQLTVPKAKRKRQNTTYKPRRNTMNFIMKNAQPINNIQPPLKRFRPNGYKPSLPQINIPTYHQHSQQFGQMNQAQLMEQFAIFQSIQQQQMLSAFQQQIQNAQKISEETFQREQSLIDYEQIQLRNSKNESAEQYAMQQSLLLHQPPSGPPIGKYVNYNYKSGESGSFEVPAQNHGAQYNDIFEYNEMNGINNDDTEKNNTGDLDFDTILQYNTDNNIENVETVTPKTVAVITPKTETMFSPLDNAKQIVIKLKENKIERISVHYRPSKYIGFSLITLISGDDDIDFSLSKANKIRSVLSWLWKGNNNEEKRFHMGDAQCEELITKTNGAYVVNAELKEFVYNHLRDSELWKDCKRFMKEVAANGKKKKTRKKTINTNVLSAVPALE